MRLIDADALIDAMRRSSVYSWSLEEDEAAHRWAERLVEAMPSAQPDIIRCTECKHYREYDSKYVENAVVVQCMADRYPISEIIPDGWFCAGAERKDDE